MYLCWNRSWLWREADLRVLGVAVRVVVVPLRGDLSETGLASDLQQALNLQWIQ